MKMLWSSFWAYRSAIAYWSAVVVLSIGLGLVVAAVIDLREEQQETEQALERSREGSALRQDTIDRQGDTIDLLVDDTTALRRQLEDLGEVPRVPDRDDLPRGPEGERGERGEPGRAPTESEVRVAVSRYLAANPPQPGRAPTSTEIEAAVSAYCADGRCVGSSGADGDDGSRGPGPSVEQVAAAVDAYCAGRNGCRGPAGADGRDGVDGSDGSDGTDGEDGRDGVDGEDGADSTVPGPPGADGEDGTDGEPPASWTFQDQAGRTYLCERDEPFDPEQPTYTCTGPSRPNAP